MQITADMLVDNGILHPALYRWERHRIEKLDRVLSGGGKATENDVTSLMAVTDGDVERAIISAVCHAAGIEYSPFFRLISGTEFRQDTKQKDGREIDLIVKDKSKDDSVVAAIEAKFGARVNGEWGYCPIHAGPERGYSNQVICYTHGCINDALDPTRVSFVWLGIARRDTGPLWGNRAINNNDGPQFDVARAEQAAATKLWRMLTWADVYDRVESTIDDPGVAVSFLRALGATTDRRRRSAKTSA